MIAALFVLAGAAASAAEYPSRPLRMIVPFPAAGGADIFARLVSRKLADQVGQGVVVDNRAGASGIIGSEAVAKAPADGYTLLVMSSGDAIVQALLAKSPRDLELGFAPVSLAIALTMSMLILLCCYRTIGKPRRRCLP